MGEEHVGKAAQLARQKPAETSTVTRTVRESALWVFGAVAIILLLALMTYHPDAPGFSHTGSGGMRLNNQIGAAGAWFADLSFYLAGMPAFLIPAMVFGIGWMLFAARFSNAPLDRVVLATRTAGFLLALLTSCGLATLHFYHPDLRESAGGILGQLIGNGLESALGLLGATLLMLSLWLAAISLFTGLSWLDIMDGLGRFIISGLEAGQRQAYVLADRLAARKELAKRQQSVKAKRKAVELRPTKPKPRIEPKLIKTEKSTRAEKERQVPMFESTAAGGLPPLSLLDEPAGAVDGYSEKDLEQMSRLLELKLADFGVEVTVVEVQPGPVVTRFELDLAPGVKASKISNLSTDIARSLSTTAVRVVEVIPGKTYVGLEIPNEVREMVTLGEIIGSRIYEEQSSPLTLALGKDISGKSVVADLAKMPHLLVAGTTGAGKSVAINAMVLSLLYKAGPEDVRLIMIDPKMLELSVYEGIPHLLAPVVTDMKEAANSLRWCVAEMDRRYKLMSELKVRNLTGYNRKVRAAIEAGKPIPDPVYAALNANDDTVEVPDLQPLPNIVVIIDELADMMMLVGKKVEELIARLAQKARASGIHLVVATQRPSVDVITGLIKANIPSRIAFQVSARVDSRTILDQSGAENLLGQGDMLFLPGGDPTPTRVHGAFVSDEEVVNVVDQLKATGGPAYIEEVTIGPSAPIPGISGEPKIDSGDDEQDPLYDQAVQIVVETRRASISGVQRRLKIGYNRAARLVETMEAAGIVGELQSNGTREILVPPPQN
ncbi:MAG: cell division protein FtsK [Gammaproteobacteria bacterium]|nr:cell division protein FtsK [Gammaproteobacteria bacterium]